MIQFSFSLTQEAIKTTTERDLMRRRLLHLPKAIPIINVALISLPINVPNGGELQHSFLAAKTLISIFLRTHSTASRLPSQCTALNNNHFTLLHSKALKTNVKRLGE